MTVNNSGVAELRLQTFPTAAFNEVTTLTLSVESTGGQSSVVGKMLIGLL